MNQGVCSLIQRLGIASRSVSEQSPNRALLASYMQVGVGLQLVHYPRPQSHVIASQTVGVKNYMQEKLPVTPTTSWPPTLPQTPFQVGDFVRDRTSRQGKVVAHFGDIYEIAFDDSTDILDAQDLYPGKKESGTATQDLFGIAEPSSSDLALINRFQPSGLPEVTAVDGLVASFLVADNMVDRSFARWTVDSLRQLKKSSTNIPLLLDHDVTSVMKVQGLVFNSLIAENRSPSYEYTDTSVNTKINRKIAREEGYVALVLRAFIPNNSGLIDRLRFGVGKVSLGYSYKDIGCPLCKISFYDEKCPHKIPLSYADTTEPGFAPYRNKLLPIEATEFSLVVEPNLPGAGIVQNRHDLTILS